MTPLLSGALHCDHVESDHADRQRRENCLRAVVRLPRRAAQGAEHLKGSAVSANPLALAPVEDITRVILVLRGHKVLLDTELATLYGSPLSASMSRFAATTSASLRISCSNSPPMSWPL